MTPYQLTNSYIRWKANVSNVSPWDDATLLPLVNLAKDNVAQAIVQVNPDYFGEISTDDTVGGQQEYTKPSGLILMKRVEISYTNTNTGSYYPAKLVTLAEMTLGEDWYAANQPTSQPLIRFDDTGLFLYPTPIITTAGSAFLRLWWVPKPADISSLSDTSADIEDSTGIGSVFQPLIGDIVVNWIRERQGTLTALDVQQNNQHILDILVPSAFRQLSTPTAHLPSDTTLQL